MVFIINIIAAMNRVVSQEKTLEIIESCILSLLHSFALDSENRIMENIFFIMNFDTGSLFFIR
jgi:hypothetical protein